jgi:hypothetical protein
MAKVACPSRIRDHPAGDTLLCNKALQWDRGSPLIQLKVLKVMGFCGDGRAVIQLACGSGIGRVLKATGLSGSGGCSI